MPRSIYVPLLPDELRALAEMAAQERRTVHDQGAHLISLALARWKAAQDFEASLDATEVESVA